jgi:hypothetical protein
MAASSAAECPNCYTDNDNETDCPHLLAGDDCPNCGTEMEKPRAGKVECPNCEWVVNGQNQGLELRDFNFTFRQASRFLQLFGYDRPATPGNAGSALRKMCHEQDLDRDELNDIVADLRMNPPSED